MAVSAENRVRSVQGYAPLAFVGPRADAPVAGGHLAMVAWLYAGITYSTGAPAPVTAAFAFVPHIRPRRR